MATHDIRYPFCCFGLCTKRFWRFSATLRTGYEMHNDLSPNMSTTRTSYYEILEILSNFKNRPRDAQWSISEHVDNSEHYSCWFIYSDLAKPKGGVLYLGSTSTWSWQYREERRLRGVIVIVEQHWVWFAVSVKVNYYPCNFLYRKLFGETSNQ